MSRTGQSYTGKAAYKSRKRGQGFQGVKYERDNRSITFYEFGKTVFGTKREEEEIRGRKE